MAVPAVPDLSPLGLFLMADPVVKTVMVLLFLASIWTWVVIGETMIRLRAARRSFVDGEARVGIEAAGRSACHALLPGESIGETRARIEQAMRSKARATLARVDAGLPWLATIASAAPFIGLFGTVWGIMRSFTAIAGANDTSLAVVAPGIAEALAATALGLVAAIPATIAYNMLATRIGRLGEDVRVRITEEATRLMAVPRETERPQ
jgi:biopolymer transport protein ExbB/TolQ